MDGLIAALAALLDELSGRSTGVLRGKLDDGAIRLAITLADARREAAEAADRAAQALREDADLIGALTAELAALDREAAELTARNAVLAATCERLEAQHLADRAHIRALIADMVRRDVR